MDRVKKFFITFISILFFAMVLIGVYMSIQYAGARNDITFIFLGVALAGILGLVIEIIIYLRKNKKDKD